LVTDKRIASAADRNEVNNLRVDMINSLACAYLRRGFGRP
jgi:hypothetical protein